MEKHCRNRTTPMHDLRDRAEAALKAAAPSLGLPPDEIEVTAVSDGVASVRVGAGCVSCSGGVTALVAMLEAELTAACPEIQVIELGV